MPGAVVDPQPAPDRRSFPKQAQFIRRVLEHYAKFRPQFESDKEFCQAVGVSYGYFRKLRSRDQRFRETLERLDSGSKAPAESSAAELASARWPDLEPWKGLFLELYRSSHDRMQSADAVDKTWRELKEALAADPAFTAGYEEIEEEIQVRVEDRKKRDAIAGKGSSADRYLEARGSELSKSPKDKKNKRPNGSGAASAYAALVASKAIPAPAQEAEEPSDALALAGSEMAPS